MKSVFKKLSAFLLIFALIFSLASCSLTDAGNDETTTELQALSPLPDGKEAVLSYVNKILAAADKGTPAFNINISTDASDFECENELVKSAFKTIKGYMVKGDSETVDYGSKLSEKLPGNKGIASIDPAIVKSATAEWPDVENAMNVKKANDYDIVIEFNDNLSVEDVLKYFGMTDKTEVLKEFEKSSDYFKLNDYSAEYTGCKLELKVNVQTDEVNWIKVTRASVVNASATCLGAFESAGDVNATFNFYKIYEFKDFDWNAPKETEPTK
ncbi:MAG: hypothetical protein K5756_08185 [Clostridiales bacterium]|nr:hypothetical protein [Clostridiales bacterium]